MAKLLTRLAGLGRSGGLISSFINRRRSSIHVVPTPSRRHMVTTVPRRRRKEPSGQAPAPAPAAEDTRWMVLNHWCCATDSTAVDIVANASVKTVAETHTSRGPLRVSLSRAAPPAISFLCFDWAASEAAGGGGGKSPDDDDGFFSHAVIAAHGDSVLLRFGDGYFVYKAAAAAGHGQPPSLSLLPACRFRMYRWEEEYGEYEHRRTERELDKMDTGLLRCGGQGGSGGGDFLVAQLQVAHEAPFDTAELCVLRPGRRAWELKEAVPIVHHDGGRPHDLERWKELSAAVPAGNRFLCWVSYDHGTLLVCDMAEKESPKLRYVPLPVKAVPPPPKEDEWDDDDDDDEHKDHLFWMYYRSIGATPPPDTDALAAVRFVSIDRRCCCGAPVIRRSVCERSGTAFTVTTWTLALSSPGEEQPLTWVKDGVLDCEELWALLAGYEKKKGLPLRAWPTCPVVSSEKPGVVCFVVAEEDMDGQTNGKKKKTWTVEVDMRRKTLMSVVPCPPHPVRCVNYCNHLPA